MSSHAVAISDRSYKEGQGTASWMFYDSREPTTSLGEGALMTPGVTRAQGSYRSKLSSIYRIITTINVVTTYYQQPQGTILIVCDGEAASTKSMQQWTSNPLDKQFDVIHAIRAGIRKTKVI